MSGVVQSCTLACIEAEQECTSALLRILINLVFGIVESIVHLVPVYFFVAHDLVFADAILLYAYLKLVTPHYSTRHVMILDLVA